MNLSPSIKLSKEYNLCNLRVVQPQAIWFLKSRSERIESDIERLLNWMSSSSSDFNRSRNSSFDLNRRFMSYPTLSDIGFKNKMAWVWSSDSELPLSVHYSNFSMNSCLEYYSIVIENLVILLIGNHLNIIELYYWYICLYGFICMVDRI